MSSRTPIVRQVSWLAVVPQLVALLACAGVGSYLAGPKGVMGGVAFYLVYSVGSRRMVLAYHRRGILQIKQERFDNAIDSFKTSLAMFDRYEWIDRFRAIVIMAPSAASYREMALINLGYCYAQIGDGVQSRAAYEECLARFPNSAMARAAMRMLDAGKIT